MHTGTGNQNSIVQKAFSHTSHYDSNISQSHIKTLICTFVRLMICKWCLWVKNQGKYRLCTPIFILLCSANTFLFSSFTRCIISSRSWQELVETKDRAKRGRMRLPFTALCVLDVSCLSRQVKKGQRSRVC